MHEEFTVGSLLDNLQKGWSKTSDDLTTDCLTIIISGVPKSGWADRVPPWVWVGDHHDCLLEETGARHV